MRRLALLIPALILAVLLCGGCFAENAADGISDALGEAGIKNPVQLQVWGDTAACFAQKDGKKTLCVLEKQDGSWRLVIENTAALIWNEDWPELYLDSDNAIFWTYALSDQETLRYHSARNTDGVWGPVDQYYADSGFGDCTHAWGTLWDEAHGGEIIRSFAIIDENDNTSDGYMIQYLPAAWLKDCIRLADFDLSRFPTLIDLRYGAGFETDFFFRDAAAALMPDCTYIRGVLKDGQLHFLVQKPNGDKVYVICEYASRRKARLIESAPLPDDVRLGRENFTRSLWINEQCVTIHLLNDQETMSVECVYDDRVSETVGGFLFIGDRAAWTDVDEQTILYGDHPWRDATAVDWNTLTIHMDEAAAQMDAGKYAVVANPNRADRLHLREMADRNSRSLGKYYNGTPVLVLAEEGDWAQVTVGGRQGYMMKRYLAFGEAGKPLRLDTSAMPQLLSRAEMLRVYAQPQMDRNALHYGDSMKIIGIIGNEWYHVWFPATGEYGFVKQSDMWEGNG